MFRNGPCGWPTAPSKVGPIAANDFEEVSVKKTFLVKPGHFWELARQLMSRYGTPSVSEILTIYLVEEGLPDYLKITLTNSDLRWNWFERVPDHRGSTSGPDGRRPYKTTVTDLSDLKSKLILLAKKFSNKGQVTSSKTYRFFDPETGFSIDMRPDTLVGEIVSIEGPRRPVKDHHDYERMKTYEIEISDHATQNGLPEKISENMPMKEFISQVGDSWMLAPDVTDFCARNGIVNAFHTNPSKRQLLDRRDNNYSMFEDFFQKITGVELLSRSDHYEGVVSGRHSVSIIIPYFNSGVSINKTLLGIASQQIDESVLSHLEVVVVDDASSIGITEKLVHRDYPFKLKIVSLSENSGVAHAREIGVVHSVGDILVFLDSDIVLSKHYLSDHIVRNSIIPNGVFVSFKQDVDPESSIVTDKMIELGLDVGDYSRESRTNRSIPIPIANSEDSSDQVVNMLEETFYFKNFHGSQKLGLFSVAGMIVGHNFSMRRELVEKSQPFSRKFKGWGMEDYYTGIQVLLSGGYIIPVLSSSVYHLDHEPRSGSNEKKSEEARRNLNIIEELLDQPANKL